MLKLQPNVWKLAMVRFWALNNCSIELVVSSSQMKKYQKTNLYKQRCQHKSVRCNSIFGARLRTTDTSQRRVRNQGWN